MLYINEIDKYIVSNICWKVTPNKLFDYLGTNIAR